MEYVIVLDVSSILWDESDFSINQDKYYDLASKLPILFTKLEEQNACILLRKELLDEMIGYFPFGRVSSQYFDFETVTISFLTSFGKRMITYPNSVIDISSVPNLIKPHFASTTSIEIQYLITQIYTNVAANNIYFTFEYLWGTNDNLKLQAAESTDIFEYETIISDQSVDLDKFFDKFKRKFSHNPKHDKYKAKGKVSGLKCYSGKDSSIPQKLLEEGVKSGKAYYNFDIDNDVYIVFPRTLNNTYHGYDEMNFNDVPPEIRKIYNK